MLIGRRPRSRNAAPPRRHARAATRAQKRRAVLAAAVSGGLVATSTLVWQSSHAAFVRTTANPGNSWGAGVVRLSDDHAATALFTTASEGLLVPGSSGHECITVTYTGDIDTADTGVRLHGALTTDSTELANALEVTVQMTTTALRPVPDADCLPTFEASSVTYATRAFSAFPTSYGTGIGDANGDTVGDWRPSATTDRSRTYEISYRLPAAPTPAAFRARGSG